MSKLVEISTIGAFIFLLLAFFGINNIDKIKKLGNETFFILYYDAGVFTIENKKYFKSIFLVENTASKSKIDTSSNKTQPYIDFGLDGIHLFSTFVEKSNDNVLVAPILNNNKISLKITSLKYDEWFKVVVFTDKKLEANKISFIANIGDFKVDSKIHIYKNYDYLRWLFCFLVLIFLTGLIYYLLRSRKVLISTKEQLLLDKNSLITQKNEEKEKLENKINELQNTNYELIGENKATMNAYKEVLSLKIKEES